MASPRGTAVSVAAIIFFYFLSGNYCCALGNYTKYAVCLGNPFRTFSKVEKLREKIKASFIIYLVHKEPSTIFIFYLLLKKLKTLWSACKIEDLRVWLQRIRHFFRFVGENVVPSGCPCG